MTDMRTPMRKSISAVSNNRKSSLNHIQNEQKRSSTAASSPLLASAFPKSPTQNKNTSETPKATDPIMARIRRDLNSPSAAARIRANKALKSPGYRKANYQIFDIPHEEQDLVTEEERMITEPPKPKTLREIFAGCCIYVEVRSGDDNRSAGIKNKLLTNGINVNEKLYKNTTHVIFKDGLLSTYNQAKKLGIPVTTILWIDTCKYQRRLVDPSKFTISNLDRYEHPELYKRFRRPKSMQPDIAKVLCGKSLAEQCVISQDTPNVKSIAEFSDEDTIIEENERDDSTSMELTMQDQADNIVNTSILTPKGMNIESLNGDMDAWKKNRRFTTFTPNPMEQTEIAEKPLNRRRTLFTPLLLSQESNKNDENTPPLGGSGEKIVFNSANRISKSSRRSIFDISMNILDINCKVISQNSQNKINDIPLLTPADKPIERQIDCFLTHSTQLNKPQVVRKRKLFNIEDHEMSEDHKENIDETMKKSEKKRQIVKPVKKVVKTTSVPPRKSVEQQTNRRKTISFFKTDKPKETIVKSKAIIEKKPETKFIVCTNMSSTDKQILQTAVLKLGGRVEQEVTARTTHVVTNTTDRTMNLLRGVIRQCTIVSPNWIHKSIEANKWLETTLYQQVCNSNKVNERSILGKDFKNMTFAHCGKFYLNRDTIDSEKKVDYIREVILLCNGKVTENKLEAEFIVTDRPLAAASSNSNTTVKYIVLSSFVFQSAMEGKIMETLLHKPKSNK